MSKNSKARSMNAQSYGIGSWRVATRPDTSGMSSSDAYPDTPHHHSFVDSQARGAKTSGVASFIGIDEFDFPLGENDESGQSSSRLGSDMTESSTALADVERLGQGQEAHEMDDRFAK